MFDDLKVIYKEEGLVIFKDNNSHGIIITTYNEEKDTTADIAVLRTETNLLINSEPKEFVFDNHSKLLTLSISQETTNKEDIEFLSSIEESK